MIDLQDENEFPQNECTICHKDLGEFNSASLCFDCEKELEEF